MKQFTFLLAAVALGLSGCQPAPIVINNQGDNGHERCRPPVIIERPLVIIERPPVIIQRPPVIIQRPPVIIQRPPVIICSPHRHCGCCPTCRSNGWVTAIGIGIGIQIGGHHH